MESAELVVGQWYKLDYDEEMGPLHGMYGSMEAEFEVQRTIKRAELTAFFALLKKVIGPIKIHVGNKGTIDGSRKGEKECFSQEREMQTYGKIWEELHGVAERGNQKRKEKCRSLRSLSLKATRRLMSWQCRMKDIWQKQKSRNYAARKRRGVCSTAVCGQLPLPGRTMERL